MHDSMTTPPSPWRPESETMESVSHVLYFLGVVDQNLMGTRDLLVEMWHGLADVALISNTVVPRTKQVYAITWISPPLAQKTVALQRS